MQTTTFQISNRRYIGSKAKLVDWIFENMELNNIKSACDIFAGSGIISNYFINFQSVENIVLNDILLSNYIIYHAFFMSQNADFNTIFKLKDFFNNGLVLKENYFSDNFSNKFFSYNDCVKIGSIREYIEMLSVDNITKNVLLASLIYSMDKVANTVGHYEAYRKSIIPQDKFIFQLISPIKHSKNIQIYRENANELAKKIYADIFFIDPPYNSRQYSRFYHIYENLVEWKKPMLNGIALKPEPSNMSEYCRSRAPKELQDLILNIDCKMIALTYNNTYNSKSNSSQNKITLEEIVEMLSKKGKVIIKEQKHTYFNAGKTDLPEHKEYLFLVKVEK